MEVGAFCCSVCSSKRALQQLVDLDCCCLVCSSCCEEHIAAKLVHVPAAKQQELEATVYTVGQAVRYRQRDGYFTSATVTQVDRSVQPYAYGIQLEGAVDVRFTEYTRLQPVELQQTPAAWMEQGLPVVRCPACGVSLNRPQLHRICPEALQQLDEALTNAWLEAKGIIRCPTPGCEALIEKLPAELSTSSHCTCATNSNSPSSATDGKNNNTICSSCWMLRHRYRCPACSQSFCDGCRKTPYHEGLTCREAAAPCCHFCGVRMPEALDLSIAGLSNRELLNEAQELGADAKWCLERSELVAVYKRARQVCQGCRVQLSRMCTKQLACSHWCCGVRGTSPCLPCLEPGCGSQAAAAGDGSCCFCFELLQAGAVVQLACPGGHFVHLNCAKQRLHVGCPGPALTFDYLFCPLCGSGKEGRCGNIQVMTAQPHLPCQLQAELARPLELRGQVVQLAKARLRLTGLAKQDQELQPGGRFDGRPADYAIAKYLFYECSRCHLPYFGGAKECGAAPQQQAAAEPPVFDAQELICGSCSAAAAGADCPHHGRQFVEWKCKYCCNLASWFCWGTTHMCSSCHDHLDHRHGNRCPGAGRCALRVPHPAPGESCCLGCGVCRYKDC